MNSLEQRQEIVDNLYNSIIWTKDIDKSIKLNISRIRNEDFFCIQYKNSIFAEDIVEEVNKRRFQLKYHYADKTNVVDIVSGGHYDVPATKGTAYGTKYTTVKNGALERLQYVENLKEALGKNPYELDLRPLRGKTIGSLDETGETLIEILIKYY